VTTTVATTSAADRAYLAAAVALGTSVRGRTAPNPGVGCLLVRDGQVVGVGATEPAGGPHAEAVALAVAGASATGATAYVTLEPCAHRGRTPPCTGALLAAGVVRVVVAHRDPHAPARGGAEVLRDAGVRVDLVDGPLRDAVAEELEGFLTVVAARRPHVTLKLAQSVAGELVAERRWLTGEVARRAVHRWRRAVDAVLVGSGTVLADDPRLDVRDVTLGARPQPRAVVLDARLRTPPTAQVVARGALVLTGPDAPAAARDALEQAGAEVVTVAAAPQGGLALPAALEAVADAGLNSVLAEPGRTLAQALLDDDLVDRLVLHIAGSLQDGPAGTAVRTPPAAWRTARVGGAGTDLIWERVRLRTPAPPPPSPPPSTPPSPPEVP
jgi:diaminohydroxyphosphoribosylaminopyrimidine deaminase / 5-amino-6-(5-phosphoribosylamino)uracil reductase